MSVSVSRLLKVFIHPLMVSVLSAVFLIIFAGIVLLTYGPIAVVELQYQSQRIMRDVFHANDVRSIILPNIHFETITDRNTEFGMVIPKLFLDEPIIFNVDPHNPTEYTAALKKGIAHAAGTALPAYDGLGYYFAHSSTPDLRNQYNAVFYLLGKLEAGDEVDIWFQKTKYAYIVNKKVITSPTDVSFLNTPSPGPTIVLQTCWPPGTTLKRLLIFAERKTTE